MYAHRNRSSRPRNASRGGRSEREAESKQTIGAETRRECDARLVTGSLHDLLYWAYFPRALQHVYSSSHLACKPLLFSRLTSLEISRKQSPPSPWNFRERDMAKFHRWTTPTG